MILLRRYHSTRGLTHECRDMHVLITHPQIASRREGSGPMALQLIRWTQITSNLLLFNCYITVTSYCASRENSSRKINNSRLSIHLETSCWNSWKCFSQPAPQPQQVFFVFPPYSIMPDSCLIDVKCVISVTRFIVLGCYVVLAYVVNFHLFPVLFQSPAIVCMSVWCIFFYLSSLVPFVLSILFSSPVHSLSELAVCTALYFFHLSR